MGRRMKHLEGEDNWAKMECSNGHMFNVDACGEENLYWDGKSLRAECPKCGEKE